MNKLINILICIFIYLYSSHIFIFHFLLQNLSMTEDHFTAISISHYLCYKSKQV